MLDLIYIEQFSLAMDLKLMLRTLTIFFRRDSTEGFGEKEFHCPPMRVKPADATGGTVAVPDDPQEDAYPTAL